MRTGSTRVLVFNGWAAGPEAWELTTFPRDWTFSYIEQLDGLPEKVIEDFDEVVLVGFSMGSTTALRLLCRWPEKVKGLVLVSATPRMMADTDWPGFSPRRLEAFLWGTEIVFQGNPSPLYDITNMKRGLDYLERTDLREDLKVLKGAAELEVAVIHSERDGIVRPHNAAYFRRIFPRAEVTMVPGSEHVLPITAPELVDKAVADMLSDRGFVV